jgi:hypothetical protein
MADNTTNFDIRFKTTADLAAAKQTEQAVKGVKAANEQLDQSQDKVAGSGKNMGNALLQGSRAIQDMQYGLAGAVNNLEGIASALGLGAGVAGVVTVLAVAVQTLGPKVVEWFASLDKEGAKVKATAQTFEAFTAQLREGFDPAQQAAKASSEAFEAQLTKERTAIDDARGALEIYIQNLRLKNQIQDTADQAIERRRIEDIRQLGLPPEEQARREALVKQATLDARKARQEQEAAAAEQVARDEIELARAQAQSTQGGIDTAQRDFRDTQSVAALTDPKNAGSISGLQKRVLEKRGIIDKEMTTPSETGPDMNLIEEINGQIQDLERIIAEREAFIDAVIGRTGGAGLGAIQARLDELKAKLAKDNEAINTASKAASTLTQQNAIRAVGRENVYQSESQALARDFTMKAAPGTPVFNEASTGAQSGQPFMTPLGPMNFRPGQGMGGLNANPLNQNPGNLGAPLGSEIPNLAAPLDKAADALQGNPLQDLASQLGKPLDSIASSVEAMAKSAKEAVDKAAQVESRIKTLEGQQKNNR